ncbi:hypothetical protein E2C01_000380 [Portunus trituberculatus]|uniref:Uncharacterized protein n=1 Tax=Portunus trituberculatus TaxID=210409 RepID=A0A5B7CJL6_PORTR|nr:hypothetical protein [Portunus trituberculatus]
MIHSPALCISPPCNACTVSFQHHHSLRPRSNYNLILERHFRVLARSQDVTYFLHPGRDDKTKRAKYGSIRDTLAVPYAQCEAFFYIERMNSRALIVY